MELGQRTIEQGQWTKDNRQRTIDLYVSTGMADATILSLLLALSSKNRYKIVFAPCSISEAVYNLRDMKKIIFTLFLMIGAICANAQTAKIYNGGTVVQTIDNIDSVRFCQETTTIDIPSYAFSVAADKKVLFSPGNLQYTQSTNTWAFAANQYDIIGEANVSDGALADKIDLFGWSASNTTAPFGISLSQDAADYAGNFVDWGTNTIGTDAPNTWRTLTNEEWIYLFQHTHWTMAKVNDLLGFMLLPDGFVAPEGLTIAVLGNGNLSDAELSFSESDYAGNVYTAAEFAQLEAMGCVFLPCTGYRNGSYVNNVGSNGYYWSATPYGSDYARYLYFNSTRADANDWGLRCRGRSVRLVQDVKTPAAGVKEIKTRVVTVYQQDDKAHRFAEVDSVVVAETPVVIPVNKFAVAEGKYVAFSSGNLQYQASTDTWRFAKHQYDYIGDANSNISVTYTGWIDLFGWGTGNHPTQSSTDFNNDYPVFVDWGTNRIGDDAPNTWRTLTCDEWAYLFRHTRWTMAKVNDTLCFMLLPTDFIAPSGITIAVIGNGNMSQDYLNFTKSDYAGNVYTATEFAQLEALGCVFLPCTGGREDTIMTYVGYLGSYWSATPLDLTCARRFRFNPTYANANDWTWRHYGNPVRLVKDL